MRGYNDNSDMLNDVEKREKGPAMFKNKTQDQARDEILASVRAYCEEFHEKKKPF